MNIDRDTAARLGITVSQIDNTLYDAFGQRQVSTIYVARNQYHVVMEVAPEYWQDPQTLRDVYVSTSAGPATGSQTTNAVAGTIASSAQAASASSVAASAVRNQATNSIGATGKAAASTGTAVSTSQETMIPLSSVAAFGQDRTSLVVNHQDGLVANTISFNLPQGVSLSTAVATIEDDHGPDRSARRRSAALSRVSPRFSRNRSAANRFSLSRRSPRSISLSACSMRVLSIR